MKVQIEYIKNGDIYKKEIQIDDLDYKHADYTLA